MNYNIMRDIILRTNTLEEALNLLLGEDKELRRHLENLVNNEWSLGYQAGYNQGRNNEYENNLRTIKELL